MERDAQSSEQTPELLEFEKHLYSALRYIMFGFGVDLCGARTWTQWSLEVRSNSGYLVTNVMHSFKILFKQRSKVKKKPDSSSPHSSFIHVVRSMYQTIITMLWLSFITYNKRKHSSSITFKMNERQHVILRDCSPWFYTKHSIKHTPEHAIYIVKTLIYPASSHITLFVTKGQKQFQSSGTLLGSINILEASTTPGTKQYMSLQNLIHIRNSSQADNLKYRTL